MLNRDLRNKIYGYITRALGLREYVRGWLKGNCPSCGRHDKYGVNIGRNRTNCFVCGYNPSPLALVMEIEGLETYRETLMFLKAYDGKEYLEPIVKRVERVDVRLPEGYKNIIFGKSLVARRARSYVRSRGFDVEEVSYKGWGYCTTGRYLGYIIIPFYVGGKLIYFNARRYLGHGPKYNNPTIDDFGIGKSLIIYNLDALVMYNEIYLVEGAINADTIGPEATASGGKKISHYQISAIIKSPVKKVNIILDTDGWDDAVKVGMQMAFHKKVRVVHWDEEKDINDLGREETLRRVNETPWHSYNDLLKIKFDNKL